MQVCMYICGTLPFSILRDTIQHVRGTRFKLDSIANFRNFWTAYDPCETSLCFLLLFFYTPNSLLYFICFTIPPCFRLFSFSFLPLFLNLFSTFVYFIFLSLRFISFLFARTFRFHSYSGLLSFSSENVWRCDAKFYASTGRHARHLRHCGGV